VVDRYIHWVVEGTGRYMDTIILRRPPAPLAPYINRLWYYRVESPGSRADWLLPDASFQIVISLTGPVDESLVAGPRSRATLIDPAPLRALMGVHFKPAGAPAILGHAGYSFRDLDVPIDSVWPRLGRELHERLLDVVEPDHGFAILAQYLLNRLDYARVPHPVVLDGVSRAQAGAGSVPVCQLVADSGLSHRRFNQLFKDHVGFSPKRFSRILRFQHLLRLINQCSVPDWSRLAFEAGYADQSHMIREFRALAGIRPSDYIPRWPEHPGHVPAD
jgi:AraC-like DNA-binding protein